MVSNQLVSDPQETTGADHIDSLYRYALSLTRNRSEAEDLVQETYVRALGASCRLRPDSNVKSWLFTILRNLWLNQWRRRRSGPQFVDADGSRDGPNGIVASSKNPYESYVSNEESNQVRGAIQQLPAVFREIILLREYEELSYHEISVILDCPPGTVMSRLARARSTLRVLLAGRLGSSDLEKNRGRN
jgi:RNA polymerase sigma-70 factor, ECF subfamily